MESADKRFGGVVVGELTLRKLVARGMELYPASKSMRKRWVKQTSELLVSRRHGLLNGGWQIANKRK